MPNIESRCNQLKLGHPLQLFQNCLGGLFWHAQREVGSPLQNSPAWYELSTS